MRRIDGKFHIDGERIVKTSNGEEIPEDEPVILFRARDHLALPMLHDYLALSIDDGCNEFHMDGLNKVIKEFQRFKANHPSKMKQPGITRGA